MTTAEPVTAEILAVLVASHRAFLAFVEKRVGRRDLAEDIVQDAFVRSVDKLATIDGSATAWFYRVLRNAIVDHWRRQAAAERRVEGLGRDLEDAEAIDADLQRVVCACVATLADTLKPEYAGALRRIEVDGLSVKAYADEVGITSSNAGVRVFRAREALRRQLARACGTCADHGCLDCTCERAPAPRACHDATPA